jgi:hypothetical protein
MLSVLGPYCVDSRINIKYGTTGRMKIGRRNRSDWKEPTLHHFVVDKRVLWQVSPITSVSSVNFHSTDSSIFINHRIIDAISFQRTFRITVNSS